MEARTPDRLCHNISQIITTFDLFSGLNSIFNCDALNSKNGSKNLYESAW